LKKTGDSSARAKDADHVRTFDDYTGSMFAHRSPTPSQTAQCPSEPSGTEGLFEADVFTPPAPPKDKEPAEKDDSGAGTI
jgi:hypothetical protein